MPSWNEPLIPAWVTALIFFVGAALVLFIVLVVPSAYACHRTGVVSGVPTQYDVVSGCYVQMQGKWVPLSTWRAVER